MDQIINFMKAKYQNGDQVEMVIKTVKESQSGLFSNQRLLLIKAGIISYFSSIPKQFTGNSRALELSGQAPKFTIPANEISKVQLKGNELSLLVTKQSLIGRDDFDKMVKGVKPIPSSSSGNRKSDGGGYQQWIFKSDDSDKLAEFYHLINLFRTGNPKFQPHLSEIVEGFQTKKAPRKKTMEPATISKVAHSEQPRRMSEVPKVDRSIFQQIIKEQRKKTEIIKPILAESPSLSSYEDVKYPQVVQQKQIQALEQSRLKIVKQKINLQNIPQMGIIEEKPGQDKVSEISKPAHNMNQPQIEIIKTFQQIVQPKDQDKALQPIQCIQQQPQQRQSLVLTIEENKNGQPNNLKQSQIYNIQKNATFSQNYIELQTRVQFQIRQQKRRKINQLIKATAINKKSDHNAIAQEIGISIQQLTQLINVNGQQEDQFWDFVQNQLGKMLNSQLNNTQKLLSSQNIDKINGDIISDYHILGQFNSNSQLKHCELFQGQIQFESYQSSNDQQNLILKWMKSQVSQKPSKPFSSKIFNKFQYKIAVRQITYDINNIISIQGCWVVNKGGHLQEFLAYLSLQRVIKEIKSKQKRNISIQCGQAFYIKYKDYQALAKHLRVGYSYYPLKSIRALQFITKSKDMKMFQKNFPQFTINVEVFKEEQSYCFQLERISNTDCVTTSIENQLKRLVFPIDHQLNMFYEGAQYKEIEKNCIILLRDIQKDNKKITEQTLEKILQTINSNFEVDIICKLLGARIDKQTNIFFHPTILKLGNRQFGQQISLIRKARKRGNFQLSRSISKKLMSKLQYYKFVTPTSNFIQIYLQLIDLMIIQKGELHRAVPILLKVLNFLSQYQIQQYPVYLSLMKTFIKLSEIDNFIKTLQNCRLFISQMFKQNAILLDFKFYRIAIVLVTSSDPKKGLLMAQNLIQKLKQNNIISQQFKEKYLSKIIWDKCNIHFMLQQYSQSYEVCEIQLIQLQKTEGFSQSYWIEGVLFLAKSWCQIKQVNSKNGADLQKRVQRAIELSLSRQNLDMAFMLLEIGKKVIQKCKECKLPRFLETLPSFEQAKIQFNTIRQQIHKLITYE